MPGYHSSGETDSSNQQHLTFADLVPENMALPPLAVLTNGVIHGLQEPIVGDKQPSETIMNWVTGDSLAGERIYRQSLSFLLVVAAREILPGCRITVEHTLGQGLYGEIDCGRPLTAADIIRIEAEMRRIVNEDLPIRRRTVSGPEAESIFRSQGDDDKLRRLSAEKPGQVVLHELNGVYDWFTGIIVPLTGILSVFALRHYLPGYILLYPRKENPLTLPEYQEQGKLASIYFEAEQWGRVMGVPDAAELSDKFSAGEQNELIRLAEAFHEKKIAEIADIITRYHERLRIILIAGPSSSGKTTFSQRLAVQLRVNGLKPVALHLDNYFVDRDHTPRDANGDLDFEALAALDIGFFNEQLTALIQGETVSLPEFDFGRGCRVFKGKRLQITPVQPLIIEGIHGLNDRLTSSIPKSRKFKVYVSCLTQLNIDDHNRVPTTDVRLLRRIVRDARDRNYGVADTLLRWPSVRRGEERNIFPFQEDADVMFNSSLIYELPALKALAQPMLESIAPDDPAYNEGQRLLRFLSSFPVLRDTSQIPANSIAREFLGDSCFVNA